MIRAVCLSLAALALATACSHRPAPSDAKTASASKAPLAPTLTRITTANLFTAYADGAADADAAYRGKRYTVIGDVVSVAVDAGTQRLVLGSKLEPVTATGVEPNAAATLVPGAAIELDCTVTGAVVDIPNLDCGPNALPRPVSPPL